MKVPLRLGYGARGESRAAVHSASQFPWEVCEGECRSEFLARTDPSYDLWRAA